MTQVCVELDNKLSIVILKVASKNSILKNKVNNKIYYVILERSTFCAMEHEASKW